jgi:phosphatidate cytidylyltransferase
MRDLGDRLRRRARPARADGPGAAAGGPDHDGAEPFEVYPEDLPEDDEHRLPDDGGPRRRGRSARAGVGSRLASGGGLGSRVLVAVPGIALTVALVAVGGVLFAAALCLLVVLALYEFYSLTAASRPLRWAGYLAALGAVVLAAVLDDPERGVLIGAGAGLGLVAVAGLILPRRDDVTGRMAVTAFGLLYVGVPFGLLMATRELPHGAGAVANVLVGTWVFDTASFAGGKLWGRRKIAPRTSPGKTLEGLVTGVVVGTLSVAVAGLYMDWIDAWQSLVVGLAICIAGFVGDLFESMLKRDVGAKDSGRLLLGHGGVLDRFDALMFATVAAYFTTVVLVY